MVYNSKYLFLAHITLGLCFLGNWMAAIAFGWTPPGLTGLGWTCCIHLSSTGLDFGFRSAHILLAKASHMIKPNARGVGKHFLLRVKQDKVPWQSVTYETLPKRKRSEWNNNLIDNINWRVSGHATLYPLALPKSHQELATRILSKVLIHTEKKSRWIGRYSGNMK